MTTRVCIASAALAAGFGLAVGPASADSLVQQGLGLVGQVQTAVLDTFQDVIASGRVFWRHPKGDLIRKLCEHRKFAHKDGDGGIGPCLHLPVQSHPGGDTVRLPCVNPAHASTKGPCKGHDTKVPCIHLKAPHSGHPVPKTPCVHLVAEHPDGDPTGSVTSCIHDLDPVETDRDLGLVFYDCDAAFRTKVKGWARKLRGWGAKFGAPRPLHVFNRPFLKGPYDNAYGSKAQKDPFWSHYSTFEKKTRHYLQVARSHGDATAAHELGHAITGDKCVFILSGGGAHSIEGEAGRGLALAEGWANFVSMALLHPGGSAAPVWPAFPDTTYEFETGTRLGPGSPAKIPCNDKKELCIAFALWDMFDAPADGSDKFSIGFSHLFKVFKPNFETLLAGPVIPDFDAFVDRLCRNADDAGKCQILKAIKKQDAP